MYFKLKGFLPGDADLGLRIFEVILSYVCKKSSFDLKKKKRKWRFWNTLVITDRHNPLGFKENEREINLSHGEEKADKLCMRLKIKFEK